MLAASVLSTIRAACNAVIETIQLGIPIARLEMLDPLHVRACNAYSQLNLPEKPLLLVEFHGTSDLVEDDAARFTEICNDHSPSPFHWSDDPDERKKLWKARHDALWGGIRANTSAQLDLPPMFAFHFRDWRIALRIQSLT